MGLTAEDGATALHLACESGNEECISLLLKSGAPIDALTFDDWASPLLVACFNGNKSAAKLLIMANAELDTPNAEEATALHVACHSGSVECVELLVQAGAASLPLSHLNERAAGTCAMLNALEHTRCSMRQRVTKRRVARRSGSSHKLPLTSSCFLVSFKSSFDGRRLGQPGHDCG